MKLLLIESPGKLETIKKYLGKEYEVMATKGHIRDLPVKTLAVDVNNNFEPKYEVVTDKKKLVKDMASKLKNAEKIYLATDPDREGEAISWHLCNLLDLNPNDNIRIIFNEITKDAILESLKDPKPLNLNLVDAQQARRVLDRLIGYKLSPLISKKIRNHLSAGRVQSVTLKLVVDKEREILAFVPKEYWDVTAFLAKDGFKSDIKAKLFAKGDNKKYIPSSKAEIDELKSKIDGKSLTVSNIKRSVTSSNAPAPYITSSLQQDAGNRLKMRLKQLTSIAQSLYEGIEVKGEGKVALITYIRTDSTRVSEAAQNMAKSYILDNFGDKYLPAKPNVFKSKKSAQDAHEAIRPVNLKYSPDYLKDKIDPSLLKVYSMIYNRFLASQMNPAKYNSLSIEFLVDEYKFKTTGRTMIFDGYTKLYSTPEKDEENNILPDFSDNEVVPVEKLLTEQKFTKPPARYTEASLNSDMEEKGIGRPATFVATINTLFARNYMELDKRAIKPTELGIQVVEYLEMHFDNLMNIQFTAEMEESLDEIEFGGKQWQDTIKDFYDDFDKNLSKAYSVDDGIKRPAEPSNYVCEKCGSPMVYREGRFGKFLACSNFPKCKNTKNVEDINKVKFTGICPECGATVSEKRSRRGTTFYGCDNYPNCKFLSNFIPTAEKCNLCGKTLYQKVIDGQLSAPVCIEKGCKNAKQDN